MSDSWDSVPPELHVSPAQPFRRRAMTFATFEPLKLNPKWKERMLRPRLDVRRVFGESDLPSSELGPRASAAKWARLNRARPWWARMVHPNSFERRLWDATTSVFVLLQVAQVPLFWWWPYLRLSAETLAALNGLMRLWFAAELLLNLRTGCVTTDGTLIMCARTSLRRRLLSGWLLVDLLGVVPHELFVPKGEEPARRFAGGLAGVGQRVWRASARVVRFSARVVQGKLRRDQMADAWAVSALAYRCKRGTADTALSYCEWHESALEQWLSIWRLCRQFQVTRILQVSPHALELPSARPQITSIRIFVPRLRCAALCARRTRAASHARLRCAALCAPPLCSLRTPSATSGRPSTCSLPSAAGPTASASCST